MKICVDINIHPIYIFAQKAASFRIGGYDSGSS